MHIPMTSLSCVDAVQFGRPRSSPKQYEAATSAANTGITDVTLNTTKVTALEVSCSICSACHSVLSLKKWLQARFETKFLYRKKLVNTATQ